MGDRGFCPPNALSGGDHGRTASNNFCQQERMHQQNYAPFNNGMPMESAANYQSQNDGQFPNAARNTPGASMQFKTAMSMLQHSGSTVASFSHAPPSAQSSSSYANVTAPKKSFDPYGYSKRQPPAPSFGPKFNFAQQQPPAPFIPNFIPSAAGAGGPTPPRQHSQYQNFVVEEQSPRGGSTGGTTHFAPPQPSNRGGGSSDLFGGGGASRQSPHHHFSVGVPPFHQQQGNRATTATTAPAFQHMNSAAVPSSQARTSSDYPPFDGPPMSSVFNPQMQPPPSLPQTGIAPDGGQMLMNGNGGGGDVGELFNGAGGDFCGAEMPAQYVLSNELLDRVNASSKRKALFELQIGLEQIAFDTSNEFNSWATAIKDRLVGTDSLLPQDLRTAVDILVEMAVVLDDSQYNYSRLCQFLCKNIDKFAENMLLQQVSGFVQDTSEYLMAQHLRNLVLFLAELYDKIEVKGVKNSQLAAHLFDLLNGLMKWSPFDDQTMSVTTRVLKLVGRFLENDRGPQAMDEYFKELENATKDSSESAKEKLKSVVNLRKNRWGIVEIQVSNQQQYPTIMGPDGEQFAEEDCTFIDDSFDVFGNSPSGSLYNNPMDEDNVEEDYEKFLQATAIRAAEKALEKVSIDEDDESALSSPKFMSSITK